MKGKKWRPYLGFLAASLLVGGAAALVTARGMPVYETLQKPPLTPPAPVFPVVWNILYLLMGIGAARVWLARSGHRGQALGAFWVQLGMNFLWSVWFFGMQWYGFAFGWLLLLMGAIGWMIAAFGRVDPLAGRMQIPYLLWCAFAAYLNGGIWLLNR